LSGTLELCVYRFGSDGLPVRKTRIVYVRPANQLSIKADLDRREYRPGNKATLRLSLTDDKGNGVPGALSLAAVDEAVYSVLDQMPGMERTFYLREQDLLKPVYAIYPWMPDLNTSIQPEDRNQFEQALFARTTRTVLPPNVKPPKGAESAGTAGRPVLHSLVRESFPIKVDTTAATQKHGLQIVDALWVYLAIGMAVVVYVGFWVFLSLRTLFRLHFGLVCIALVCGVGYVLTTGRSPQNTFTYVGTKVATTSGSNNAKDKAPQREMKKMGAMPNFLDLSTTAKGNVQDPVPLPSDEASPDQSGSPRVREQFPET